MGGYPAHRLFNIIAAQFTTFLKDGMLVGDFGLSLQEVQFLEGFTDYLNPGTILVVGNAHGWSTVALALMFPEASVIAVDIDSDGIAFTNGLARKNGLNITCISGRSPEDVSRIVRQQGLKTLDLILIDACHTVEAVENDFSAIHPYLNENSVILFHDLMDHKMVPGFVAILKKTGLYGKLLTRTTSGMGVAYQQVSPQLASYLDCFNDHPENYNHYRDQIEHLSGKHASGLN
ncbi:MAG: class I SAM-dependent methyltransferase [Magnetococcales bacterium]|nr:class I SAM-dependent methyltransferase [Magnetococcales bacterium]